MAPNVRRPSLRVAAIAGAVLVLVAGAVGLWIRAKGPRSDAAERVLVAAPSDSWLVLTLDVAAAWPLLQPMIDGVGGVAGATRVTGLGSVSTACGFEPLEHIHEAMIALPESGERGDFGIAFASDLPADALEACARKVITARGGHPGARARGDFTLIAGSEPAAEGGAHLEGGEHVDPAPSLAYRAGGPFLVGRGAWLDAMIDAVDGKTASANPDHEALRRALTSGANAAGRPSVAPGLVVTALLPRALRDRIRSETGASEAMASGGGMRGVLGVSQAGLAIASRGPASDPSASTDIDLELRCESTGACSDVKTLIERDRLALSGDFRARLLGLGPLIDGLSIELRGDPGGAPPAELPDAGAPARPAALSVRTHAPTGDLARTLSRLLERLVPRSRSPESAPPEPHEPLVAVPPRAPPLPVEPLVAAPPKDAAP